MGTLQVKNVYLIPVDKLINLSKIISPPIGLNFKLILRYMLAGLYLILEFSDEVLFGNMKKISIIGSVNKIFLKNNTSSNA